LFPKLVRKLLVVKTVLPSVILAMPAPILVTTNSLEDDTNGPNCNVVVPATVGIPSLSWTVIEPPVPLSTAHCQTAETALYFNMLLSAQPPSNRSPFGPTSSPELELATEVVPVVESLTATSSAFAVRPSPAAKFNVTAPEFPPPVRPSPAITLVI